MPGVVANGFWDLGLWIFIRDKYMDILVLYIDSYIID